ncbi:MAG: aminotransferase class IV [Saprospiraceae bacterium]|nr:aminotransferase class IV [Saprospiraceae bacterium]
MKQSKAGGFSEAIESVNINGNLFNNLPDAVSLMQRALYYGDALFESILIVEGRTPLWHLHWERLKEGIHRLGMVSPPEWSDSFFLEEIKKMNLTNHRLRLMVWRVAGGLYMPLSHEVGFMMTAEKLKSPQFDWLANGIVLGVCDGVRLPVDRFSNIKSLNTARYVQAAMEAQQNGWDEAVVLNTYDRVCETSSSNIFWIRQGRVYTPPATEGCVTGIVRRILLTASVKGLDSFEEKTCVVETLLEADEIFLSNAVRGIRPVRKFREKHLKIEKIKLIHNYILEYISNV